MSFFKQHNTLECHFQSFLSLCEEWPFNSSSSSAQSCYLPKVSEHLNCPCWRWLVSLWLLANNLKIPCGFTACVWIKRTVVPLQPAKTKTAESVAGFGPRYIWHADTQSRLKKLQQSFFFFFSVTIKGPQWSCKSGVHLPIHTCFVSSEISCDILPSL